MEIEHETRDKREHEIALLPTGSHVVPMTEPDWAYNMAKRRWDQNHFARCSLEGLKQVHTKTLNYAKLADIGQGEKKTHDKFLDRLQKALHKFTDNDPKRCPTKPSLASRGVRHT